jgi:anti-sigma B factor antagonist
MRMEPEAPKTGNGRRLERLTADTLVEGDSVRISLHGELDLSTVASAEEAMRQAEHGPARRLVLDLSGLTFMDSTGLRLVLRADRRSRGGDRRLRLVPGPPAVQQVFTITGTEKRLAFLAP